MPSPRLNRLLWVLVLALVVIFGLRARETMQSYLAGIGDLKVVDEPGAQSVYLKWTGQIDAPMAAKLAAVFDRHRNDSLGFVLALASPGGSLDHGAEVIRLLKEAEKTHKIETVVEAGDSCASMCVPVFLQGQRRTAAESARFLFHEVSFREVYTEARENMPSSATGKATDAFFDKYFVPAGVATQWIAKVRADMAGGHNIWKTGRALVDEASGVVQAVF